FEHTLSVNGSGPFYSDPIRLSMVFNNIISNAIRYRDPQKETSHLHITVEIKNQLAYITFADNGVGIPHKHQKKVFDMFFRGSQQSEGSGIGLYIVKEAINKLKGSVKLASAEGEGTSFYLTIPSLPPPPTT
ncbi:MAG: HAMP domain-containing sensor histidine kinase, partial [Bacteroidota bacterium]